jgi:hypothetical protein
MKLRGNSRVQTAWSLRGTAGTESTQIRWFSWQSDREVGPRERWPKAVQVEPSVLSSYRSDCSPDGQAGRLDLVTCGQRHSKPSYAQGELPGSSPLRWGGSCGGQSEGWTGWLVTIGAQMKVGKDSRQPWDLLKNRHSDSVKEKTHLTLSLGMC